MANAAIDENGTKSLVAGLETDGVTIVRITADPDTHAIMIDDGTTGSDHGPENELIDENDANSLLYTSALTAVSEADGVTPVVIYATADGNLLIDSN